MLCERNACENLCIPQVHNWSVTHASLEEVFIMVVQDLASPDAMR